MEEQPLMVGRVGVRDLVWLTYRCGFPAMQPYPFTDDAGWGCMLRSSQMLMANALCRHLGPGSRHRVLRWFADAPGDDAVYSIHNMVRCGMRYDMLPGEWYGPGVAAHVLRDLSEIHDIGLRMVVTSAEKPLCEEDVLDELTSELKVPESESEEEEEEDVEGHDPLLCPPPQVSRRDARRERRRQAAEVARRERLASKWTRSLLVVVPIRLGLSKLEDKFVDPILACLTWPQSCGFVGGRPRQALYFAGSNGRSFVGLDPHFVQPSPALGPGFLSAKHLESFICDSPRFVSANNLDPSLALAFYCRDRDDFLDLVRRAHALADMSQPPLFDVQHASSGARDVDLDADFDVGLSLRPSQDDDDDDYVVV